MTTKNDFSHKYEGHTSSDHSSTTDISIRSLLISVKKENKNSSHKASLKQAIHSELVMKCMVLLG